MRHQLEDHTPDQFLDVKSFVSCAFECFGYTWQHPRVAAWLEKVEQADGPWPANARKRDFLSFTRWRQLAIFLAYELTEGRRLSVVDEQAAKVARALAAKPSLKALNGTQG